MRRKSWREEWIDDAGKDKGFLILFAFLSPVRLVYVLGAGVDLIVRFAQAGLRRTKREHHS